MPRYEFSEGSSNKFWEITLEGTRYKVRYGKIGANGQTTLKEFDSPEKAKKEYEKIIAEKVKKGYVLAEGEEDGEPEEEPKPAAKAGAKKKGAPAGAGPDAELEAAIESDPDDAAPYLVYADWLQSKGDPRGELIIVEAELYREPKHPFAKWQEFVRRDTELLEKHVKEFFGPLAKIDKDHAKLTWQLGFIKSARFGLDYDAAENMGELVGMLLDHPSGRFLQELTIGLASGDGENEYQEVVDVLVEKKPRTLRSLFLGDFEYPDETEMSWSHIGDASRLWSAVPGLRKVILQSGSMTLGKIDLPEALEFEVHTGGLDAASIKSIASAKWPKLEKLEVWFGSENYGAEGNVEMIQPILEGKGLGKLKHLGLKNAEFTDEIAAALAVSKIVKQLETLDLSMGCMTKAGVDAILANKDSFKHLKLLNVEDNAIGEGEAEGLNGICKEVRIGEQSPDRVEEDYRYTSVGE